MRGIRVSSLARYLYGAVSGALLLVTAIVGLALVANLNLALRVDEEWTFAVGLAICGALYLVERRRHVILSAHRWWAAVPMAVGLLWMLGTEGPTGRPHALPDYGMWVERPRSSQRYGGRQLPTVEYRYNEYGMRGPENRRPAPGERVLAVVGCSKTLSSGVQQPDSFPDQLEAALRRRGQDTAVFDFSMGGIGVGTAAKLVRYARDNLPVEAVLLYLECDHLDDELDPEVRQARVENSLVQRVIVQVRLEPLWVGIQHLLRPDSQQKARYFASLDSAYEAMHGGLLMMVLERPDCGDDWLSWTREWLAAHPDVLAFDASASAEWGTAARLGDDRHWSPEGIRTVTSLLAPWITDAFSRLPPTAGDDLTGRAH